MYFQIPGIKSELHTVTQAQDQAQDPGIVRQQRGHGARSRHTHFNQINLVLQSFLPVSINILVRFYNVIVSR